MDEAREKDTWLNTEVWFETHVSAHVSASRLESVYSGAQITA